MKNFINMLISLKNGDAGITVKRAVALEIAYKIISTLRDSVAYKSARNFIFNDKGEPITEKSVKYVSEEYGYSITATQNAEKASIDYKAIVQTALMQGLLTEEFIESVPKKVTLGYVSYTVKQIKK